MDLKCLALVILLINSAAPREKRHHRHARLKKRIANGQLLNVITYNIPYQVGIYLGDALNHYELCGGALITTNFVLTAAHCLTDVLIAEVILGARSLEKQSYDTIYRLSTIFKVHSDFKQGSFENDIGLIKFFNPVILDKYLQVINLPKSDTVNMPLAGKFSGYGVTSEADIYNVDLNLRQITVDVVEWGKCTNYQTYSLQHCFCGMGRMDSIPCTGDDGGPFVVGDEVIGIASQSFRPGSCSKSDPYIFTNVGYHLGWIKANSDYQ